MNANRMKFIHNTGGRERYYRGTKTGDCVIRAIAITTNTDYKKVWEDLNDISRHKGYYSNQTQVYETYLKQLGWQEVKTGRPFPQVNQLQVDRAIVYCRAGYGTHLVAIVDGDLHDIWDCRDRVAYSYWEKA